MYADDLKIYRCIESLDDKLKMQHTITFVAEAEQNWNLPLATDKTCSFSLGTVKFSEAYRLGEETLSIVKEVRDLGFDSHTTYRLTVIIKC